MLLIPGLLHVPLPRADFHVIRHHHGPGEVCPKHDHLLRWHPLAGEGDEVAVLHWHWLLPRSAGEADPVADPSIPVAHADDGDPNSLDPMSGRAIVRDFSDVGSRTATAFVQHLAKAPACWLAPPPPAPPELGPALHASSDGLPADAALARLVRRNC
ncbi:hypothetical protein [Paludisphaera sp.]|uniref:hypothetical protein n=1 Tax=Paludisphaera sp. TaxID=2017432 RepID=UPI00301DC1C8